MAPTPEARAGTGDVVRLAGKLSAGFLKGRRTFDTASISCRWARDIMQREGGSDIRVSLLRRHLMLIANRKHSEVVLSGVPGRGAYGAGKS
ncbi:MAG: hypothetical protein ABI556_09315, partial [Gemmatimonadales bacterium]